MSEKKYDLANVLGEPRNTSKLPPSAWRATLLVIVGETMIFVVVLLLWGLL